jgi:acetate kinase
MTTERTKVLVFNPGSVSLKFQIVAADPPRPHLVRGEKLVSGTIEPIGENARLSLAGDPSTPPQHLPVKDHGAAAEAVVARIDAGILSSHGIESTRDVQIAGYRVVHGADLYRAPVLIDNQVIKAIEELEDLAP